jgi:hypothetical protein
LPGVNDSTTGRCCDQEQTIYRLLTEEFQKIYGDLVIATGDKPIQILLELEMALSHLAVAYIDRSSYDSNIHKALGHVQRATLDAAKMLWLHYRSQVHSVVNDEDLRRFCTSEQSFISDTVRAEALAEQARQHELENVGRDPMNSLNDYYEAAIAFKKIYAQVDPDKIRAYQRFSFRRWVRDQVGGLLVGILGGIIASLLAHWLITHLRG